jgi:hypothetical protein
MICPICHKFFFVYAPGQESRLNPTPKPDLSHIQYHEKEINDMAPTQAFTTGNMSNLILIRLMHDHISRRPLINLSL